MNSTSKREHKATLTATEHQLVKVERREEWWGPNPASPQRRNPVKIAERGIPLGVHPSHQRQGPAKMADRGFPLRTDQSSQRRCPVKIAEGGIPLWTGQNHKVLLEKIKGGGFPAGSQSCTQHREQASKPPPSSSNSSSSSIESSSIRSAWAHSNR